MNKELAGKVALVTGASKGIGAGVATAFGAARAMVAIGYVHDRDGAERAAAEIVAAGGRAITIRGDLGKLLRHGRCARDRRKGLRAGSRAHRHRTVGEAAGPSIRFEPRRCLSGRPRLGVDHGRSPHGFGGETLGASSSMVGDRQGSWAAVILQLDEQCAPENP